MLRTTADSSADAQDAWSPVVRGVRGRLLVTEKRSDAAGRPLVRLDLELENLSDSPVEISWAHLGRVLRLSAEDSSGAGLPLLHPGGNTPAVPPHWLELPQRDVTKILISSDAYAFFPDGRAWLAPLPFLAWELPPAHVGPMYLRGTLVPFESTETRSGAWSGTLGPPASGPSRCSQPSAADTVARARRR